MSDQVQKALEREGRHYQSEVEAALFELLDPALSMLLDHPAAARLTYQWGGGGPIVDLKPAPADLPRMIGSGGAMFESFRAVLARYGDLRGLRVRYRLQSQRPATRARPTQFQPDPAWPGDRVDAMVVKHCAAMFHQQPAIRRVDDRVQPKSNYFLTVAKDEPEWPEDLHMALSTIWHAAAYRFGRRVYLEAIRRAS
jgi:predicted RNA-binding protein YlqC (UPF0109 family)